MILKAFCYRRVSIAHPTHSQWLIKRQCVSNTDKEGNIPDDVVRLK